MQIIREKNLGISIAAEKKIITRIVYLFESDFELILSVRYIITRLSTKALFLEDGFIFSPYLSSEGTNDDETSPTDEICR